MKRVIGGAHQCLQANLAVIPAIYAQKKQDKAGKAFILFSWLSIGYHQQLHVSRLFGTAKTKLLVKKQLIFGTFSL